MTEIERLREELAMYQQKVRELEAEREKTLMISIMKYSGPNKAMLFNTNIDSKAIDDCSTGFEEEDCDLYKITFNADGFVKEIIDCD